MQRAIESDTATPDRSQTTRRGFTTKRDAEAWANQLEADKHKGAYMAPAAGRIKLGDFAREWLDSKHKLKPSTRARYRVVLDTFIADHADVALGDITRSVGEGVGRRPQHGSSTRFGAQNDRSTAPDPRVGGRRTV